jgi:hypothetical protein
MILWGDGSTDDLRRLLRSLARLIRWQNSAMMEREFPRIYTLGRSVNMVEKEGRGYAASEDTCSRQVVE